MRLSVAYVLESSLGVVPAANIGSLKCRVSDAADAGIIACDPAHCRAGSFTRAPIEMHLTLGNLILRQHVGLWAV
jgi:hypothetical protein